MTTDYAATKAGTKLGRPCGLTPQVHDGIVKALRLGATIKIAAGSVGVGVASYYQWLARGRADIEAGEASRFADFAEAVRGASHRGDVELLASVRLQTKGRQCRACGGQGTIRAGDAGGNKGDDRRLRCDGCRGSGFAIAPDGRLALDLLGRRHPDDFGRKSRQRVEVVGDGGGPVRVDVRAAAVAVDLNKLSPEQLAALAFGGELAAAEAEAVPALGARRVARDVIEAEAAPRRSLGEGLAAATVEAAAVVEGAE